MTPALQTLVREAMELVGGEKPELLEEDAPVLADEALLPGTDSDFYLVGLIGGKEVGKSALVNALVGISITAVTSHGAGTETVIAYVHASQQERLRDLLERDVPGQYQIVAHQLDNLRRQVLLDLPDIDSRYEGHLELTRKMLRHLLYPVWVGSVEKYADQQPQQMLARVAEGNTPENFVFCLNKVDQIRADAPLLQTLAITSTAPATSAPAARTSALPAAAPLDELRGDFTSRLTRTLNLSSHPRLYLISATHPSDFELPALRRLLMQQKSAEEVREAKLLAAARQDRALLAWLDEQNLPLRVSRISELQRDAEELIAARVAVPVLDKMIPRLLDDPATRMAMTDDVLQDRLMHWPIVNLVHTVLHPLFILLRSAVMRRASPIQSPEAMVDAVFKECGDSVSSLVQSAFAYLRQSQPAMAALYSDNKLWEDMPADLAARNLRRSLAEAVQRQRAAARETLAGQRARGGSLLRWTLTVGAVLWFPFVQPVLSAILSRHQGSALSGMREIIGLFIGVLGVDYLLKSVGFLLIYFATLWLALRWNTERKVTRLQTRWRDADAPDASVNLATLTMQWLDGLTAPIRDAHDQIRSLAERSAAYKAEMVAA